MRFPNQIQLENEYTASIDGMDQPMWDSIIGQFLDANIYQTWSYEFVRSGSDNLSHMVLYRKHEIVAAAQVRIVRVPLLGMGAAYVRWGPLWRKRGSDENPLNLRMVLRALRTEYVGRRKLVLRILPLLFGGDSEPYEEIFTQEKYIPSPGETPQRTLLLAIQPPLAELRKNLKQKWRNCLNRAERNQLEIVEGTEDRLFAEFIQIYRELLNRKKFREPNDINEFRKIQAHLPPEMKMAILLCKSNGSNTAGGIFSAIGDTGVYLFGATNDMGMKNKGSYLIQWKAIEWMKSKGCRYYNLNGINPTTNPGSYHFKCGVAGKKGEDIRYLGTFDSYPGPFSVLCVRLMRRRLLPLEKLVVKLRS